MVCKNKFECSNYMVFGNCNECDRMCNDNEMLKTIKDVLKNYKWYVNYEYKHNILFLLGCLEDYNLLKDCEIYDDKIVINTYNSAWLHLYNNRVCLLCVKPKTIVIYKDIQTIKINDDMFLNISEMFFNFYECYNG